MSDRPRNVWNLKQLVQGVDRLVTGDERWQRFWLEAEVGRVTAHRSGHYYFDLKEEDTSVSGVMFKYDAEKVPHELTTGTTILARASVDFYKPRGQFQLRIFDFQDLGSATWMQQIKQALSKVQGHPHYGRDPRPLPKSPRWLGLVTSASGAAYADVIETAARRNKSVRFIFAPSLVQGDEAQPQLLEALDLLYKNTKVEAILLVRGGGSYDDLMVFNDPELALKILDSPVPVVSGVGHEIDVTVVDHVVDYRAATPTEAAILTVPLRSSWMEQIRDIRRSLKRTLTHKLELSRWSLERQQNYLFLKGLPDYLQNLRKQLEYLKHRLARLHPKRVLQERRSRWKDTSFHLIRAGQRLLGAHLQKLIELQSRLTRLPISLLLDQYQSQNQRARQALTLQLRMRLRGMDQRLIILKRRLQLAHPDRILEQGYARLTSEGHHVTSAHELTVGQEVIVRMRGGRLTAKIDRIDLEEPESL